MTKNAAIAGIMIESSAVKNLVSKGDSWKLGQMKVIKIRLELHERSILWKYISMNLNERCRSRTCFVVAFARQVSKKNNKHEEEIGNSQE